MENFLKKHKNSIPKDIIKKASAYTYCNRGNYYYRIDRFKSAGYFFRALKADPFHLAG